MAEEQGSSGKVQPTAIAGWCVMTDWQTIETAPNDTLVLLYLGGNDIEIGEGWHRYDDEPLYQPSSKELYWWVDERGRVYPTHWMMLPEPPK